MQSKGGLRISFISGGDEERSSVLTFLLDQS
jgi:hypothetical protein